MYIREQHGDSPLTIRTLTEMAEREGWSLDARLSFLDGQDLHDRIVRGASIPGPEDMCINLAIEHEDEWEVVTITGPACGRELSPGAEDCPKPSYEELARTCVEEFYEEFGDLNQFPEDRDALRNVFVEDFTDTVICYIENGREDDIKALGEIPKPMIDGFFAYAYAPLVAFALLDEQRKRELVGRAQSCSPRWRAYPWMESQASSSAWRPFGPCIGQSCGSEPRHGQPLTGQGFTAAPRGPLGCVGVEWPGCGSTAPELAVSAAPPPPRRSRRHRSRPG